MAIIPESQYPGKITPASTEYPYGEARNITLPGDGTGTPWEAALVNDLFGHQQALLSEGNITPSGDPETATNSQYLAAAKTIFGSTRADMLGLLGVPSPRPGQNVATDSFFDGEQKGGGSFFWGPDVPKSAADGGTIVDPDNVGGFDGTTSTLSAYLGAQGGGVGTGCWVRKMPTAASDPAWFGALGNGSSDDTDAFNAAFLSSPEVVIYATGNTYEIGALSIPSSLRAIRGFGWPEIRANADLTQMFEETGLSDLEITGCHFRGFPGATESTSSRLMEFTNCVNVNVERNRFSNCPERPIQMIGCTRSDVNANDFLNCSNGVWFVGCKQYSFSVNRILGSQQADSQFKVGLGIAPYDPTYGINEDVVVLGNFVDGLENSQAYLIHAGVRISVHNNMSRRCSIGIDFNPIDANDTFRQISIVDNILEGIGAGVGYTPAADIGIVAYGSGVIADSIRIAGNNIKDFNNTLQSNNQGGITCKALDDAVICENTIRDCFGSGISFSTGDSENVHVFGNTIRGLTGTTGAHAALRIDTPTIVTGVIENNHLIDNYRAYRFSGSIGDFPDLYVRDNTETGSTNDSPTAIHAVFEGTRISVDNATPSVENGVKAIHFRDSAAISITDLTGGYLGQVVSLFSNSTNTTLSENSDGGGNFRFPDDLDFTFTTNSAVQVVFDGSNWQQVGRSVNGA